MSVAHNIFEFVNDHESTSSTGIIRRTFRWKNQNSQSVQCFDFLDLSSFRFIYFPHRFVYHAFSYNLVNADSKKIRVCRRINARSHGKRVLEATLHKDYIALHKLYLVQFQAVQTFHFHATKQNL